MSNFKTLTAHELASIYRRLNDTHPSFTRYQTEMWDCLKMITGHLLADTLEAEEFAKALNASKIEVIREE